MNINEMCEVTITHNMSDSVEDVCELWKRKWIGLNFGRHGKDFGQYSGRGAKLAVRIFKEMQEKGAAVVASYGVAEGKEERGPKQSERLVGIVKKGAEFRELNGLLCFALDPVQVFDSSANFLGNLVPRQCTIQKCEKRSCGRLKALALGMEIDRSVESLHHLDVEWLVTNYLMVEVKCRCVWGGGRSFADIDHAALMVDGYELLAQTTVSKLLVEAKARTLASLKRKGRKLWLFGPKEAASQCQFEGIEFHAIEAVFEALNKEPYKWLIDGMLKARRLEKGVEEDTPSQ